MTPLEYVIWYTVERSANAHWIVSLVSRGSGIESGQGQVEPRSRHTYFPCDTSPWASKLPRSVPGSVCAMYRLLRWDEVSWLQSRKRWTQTVGTYISVERLGKSKELCRGG